MVKILDKEREGKKSDTILDNHEYDILGILDNHEFKIWASNTQSHPGFI